MNGERVTGGAVGVGEWGWWSQLPTFSAHTGDGRTGASQESSVWAAQGCLARKGLQRQACPMQKEMKRWIVLLRPNPKPQRHSASVCRPATNNPQPVCAGRDWTGAFLGVRRERGSSQRPQSLCRQRGIFSSCDLVASALPSRKIHAL